MHPFQGRFAVGRLELTMMNLSNKFEVSIFTRCEHINGDAKCRKWGGLGWLGVTQGYKKCHHPTQRIRLPILNFNRNYVSILYCFRHSELFTTSRQFLPTQLHLTPQLGVTPVEFCGYLWRQKNRISGLLCITARL